MYLKKDQYKLVYIKLQQVLQDLLITHKIVFMILKNYHLWDAKVLLMYKTLNYLIMYKIVKTSKNNNLKVMKFSGNYYM